MNKKTKNIIKIILPLSIIVLVILILLATFIKPTKEEKIQLKTHKDIVDNTIQTVFFSNETSKAKLERTTENVMIVDHIFIGPDSAIRNHPENKVMLRNGLNDYKKVIDKYAKNVEQRFLNNINYELTETSDSTVLATIKPWYFDNYSTDLGIITKELLKMAGYDEYYYLKDIDNYIIVEYKARANAIKILDKHISEYDNTTNEIKEYVFDFNGNKAEENQYFSLYYNLGGVTSKNAPMKNASYAEEQLPKLKGYINDAIKEGIISKKSPLELR